MSTDAAFTDTLTRAYDLITHDADGRTCADIPDDACTNVPRNFVLNALNGAATKLAEQIASPGLVYPWFLAAVGAPTALAGFLVPIRRAGALLPQLVVAGRIRGYARRKWFWVVAAVVQAVALVLTAVAAIALAPFAAGVASVVLLALFSIASGVGSVAFTDVMGKTIPRGRRGRLLGVRATAGGVLAVLAAFGLRRYVASDSGLMPYVVLFGLAAGLWVLGALFFAAIAEARGATEGGRNALQEARAGRRILREVPGFRRFVVARGFLASVELAVPFYSLYARQLLGEQVQNLAVFVMFSAVAAVLSSPFWGRFADRSSRVVMAAGGVGGVAAAVYALLFAIFPSGWQTGIAYAPVFLLFGFAQAGVRLGRKTYLVDAAPVDERPLYKALSNSIVGVLILVGSASGVAAEVFGVRPLIIALGALAVVGVLVSWRLPEAAAVVAT